MKNKKNIIKTGDIMYHGFVIDTWLKGILLQTYVPIY